MASTRTASTVTHPDGTIAASLVHAAGVTSSALPTVQEPEPEPEESPHHRNLSLSLDQVNELLRTRLPESGGCASLERIALGFNNISYVATSRAADGKQYVIRATKDSWPPEKVRCEMACIRLMRSLTSLPVPTPLCWDASADEFGCRWILMEKMEGRVMDAEEFDALPEPQRAALTSQMVGYLEQLQALRWDSTGSFYPVESEGGQDANDSVLVGRDAVEVGPYFDGLHGPFHSSLEYALGMLRSAIAEAETKPALKPLLPYAARAKALAEQLASGALQLPEMPIVAFHGDFSLRNMLVVGGETGEEEDDLRISALLDWEWGGAKPAYCEWSDCSFGDASAASSRGFQAEAERRGLICQSSAGFAEYSELQRLGEALAPWVVGCFGAERDAQEIAESQKICEELLQSHKL
jgi:aminoglycoside phosphotransferase (APT) family kinase protein